MDQASKDAILARAAKIQSVGGSLLSNASLLKQAVEAIPVDDAPVDPPVVVTEPDPDPDPDPPTVPADPVQYGPSGDLETVSGDLVLDDVSGVEGKRITGDLYLPDPRLTVENCDVAGRILVNRSPGGNSTYPVASGHTLRNVRTTGLFTLGCDSLTLEDCDLGNDAGTFAQIIDDSDKRGYFLVRNLKVLRTRFAGLHPYTVKPLPSNAPHWEALHLFACDTALIQSCLFDFTAPDDYTRARITAALTFEDRNGHRCTDIVIEDNDVYGGGYYQAYFTIAGKSAVLDNRWHSYPGMVDVQYWDDRPGIAFSQSGNTLDGQPITFRTNA